MNTKIGVLIVSIILAICVYLTFWQEPIQIAPPKPTGSELITPSTTPITAPTATKQAEVVNTIYINRATPPQTPQPPINITVTTPPQQQLGGSTAPTPPTREQLTADYKLNNPLATCVQGTTEDSRTYNTRCYNVKVAYYNGLNNWVNSQLAR